MKSPQNNHQDALFRASQRRVAELESALQDVYTWAYTSDKLSEIDVLLKVARAASNLLPEDCDVLSLALEEYLRAIRKHPGMTLECDGHSDATRLFALVEEIGEVAACLTYDNDAETGHGSDLESEVIQVVALALAWATRYLEEK